MMTKEKIQKFKARIKRAQNSFSIGGDMMLSFDIDGMSLDDMVALQAGLLGGRIPVSYKYLDERIVKLSQKVA